MYQILNYISAFFSVVVVNCVHPANWENCSQPLDEWFWPEVAHGIEILQNPDTLYKNERIYLNDR
jgi:hypothetical protein